MTLTETLQSHAIGELVRCKGTIVDIQHSAPVRDALQLMRMHGISALPVWAPPNEWVGAGGSSILVTDTATGASKRQYIGMVSVLDVLMHFADSNSREDPAWALDTPISRLIGQCLEGLSCWALPYSLSVLDTLEPMSKGVHRVLLPLPPHHNEHNNSSSSSSSNPPIVPQTLITATSPRVGLSRGLLTSLSAASYSILTQLDLMRFIVNEAQAEANGHRTGSSGGTAAGAAAAAAAAAAAVAAAGSSSGAADSIPPKTLSSLLQLSVKEAGAVHGTVFSVPASMKVLDAIRCMQQASVSAVAVIETQGDNLEDPMIVFGQGRRLVGTLSASDLRACSEVAALTALPRLTVADFLSTLMVAQDVGIAAAFSPFAPPSALATLSSHSPASSPARMCEARTMVPITCKEHSRLGAVMAQAIAGKVHRVWVVADDATGTLVGVVTLSDILRCIHKHAEGER